MRKKNKNMNMDSVEGRPSKSAQKRQSAALQKLGEELTKLAPAARAQMDLSADLLEALTLYDRIKDNEGRRRQRQFIGKIMRSQDYEKISTKLEKLQNLKAADVINFHKAEQWREKLLAAADGELPHLLASLTGALENGKSYSHEKLNDLISRAKKGRRAPAGVAASRALFRELARMLAN